MQQDRRKKEIPVSNGYKHLLGGGHETEEHFIY